MLTLTLLTFMFLLNFEYYIGAYISLVVFSGASSTICTFFLSTVRYFIAKKDKMDDEGLSEGQKVWIWAIVILNFVNEYAKFLLLLPIFLVLAGVPFISYEAFRASYAILAAWVPIPDFINGLSILYLHHCIYGEGLNSIYSFNDLGKSATTTNNHQSINLGTSNLGGFSSPPNGSKSYSNLNPIETSLIV